MMLKTATKDSLVIECISRELLPMKEANIPSEPHDIHDSISFFCLFIVFSINSFVYFYIMFLQK